MPIKSVTLLICYILVHVSIICNHHQAFIIIIIIIVIIVVIIINLQPFLGPWKHFFSFLIVYINGRTPWTGDQPTAMRLSTYTTTQIQNKSTQ
jgi:hypothetical protein